MEHYWDSGTAGWAAGIHGGGGCSRRGLERQFGNNDMPYRYPWQGRLFPGDDKKSRPAKRNGS